MCIVTFIQKYRDFKTFLMVLSHVTSHYFHHFSDYLKEIRIIYIHDFLNISVF